jgi:Zn-finger nucleic acid-binding protein
MVNCPVCDLPMNEVRKNNVMIDVCPKCKGVWLDRGELNQLMKQVGEYRKDYADYERRYYEDDYDDYNIRRRRKKGIFDLLGDLFD